MACLQYKNASTIHHWSGWDDGHIKMDVLIEMIQTSPLYDKVRNNILNADVLIIDEIGLISCKTFEGIELICRTIRRSDVVFGGLQVIGAGSFFQLPPVPSASDPALFAFQSDMFTKVFPHKIKLEVVQRQQEVDLIKAVNELCIGKPSEQTEKLMESLSRPLQDGSDAVHIFGTNLDVDFYNHQQLAKLQGNRRIYQSSDKLDTQLLKQCTAPAALTLKVNAKIIIIRNLDNGLVNGLSGTVIDMEDDEIEVKIDGDAHMSHCMAGKCFKLKRYAFLIRDANGKIVATRLQFPLKLGYATTVDKAQGRTISKLIVDTYNFWRVAQIAVAIGRAISKDGLQILNYNKFAAHLQHPAIVHDFYDTPSIPMTAKMTCCQIRATDIAAAHVHTHAFQFAVPANVTLMGLPMHNNPTNVFDEINEQELQVQFPYDIMEYLESLMYNGITEIQRRCNKMIKELVNMNCFVNFVKDCYQFLSGLFHKFRIPLKKLKCNWCLLTSKLHTYLQCSDYLCKCKVAFNTAALTPDMNAICTKINFDLLNKIVRTARDELQMQNESECDNVNLEMELSEQNTLRYISGACIHVIRQKLKPDVRSHMVSKMDLAKVDFRCLQLLQMLQLPGGFSFPTVLQPETLQEIARKQYSGRHLTIVSDETFNFFKLMYCKMKCVQTYTELAKNPINILQRTIAILMADVTLVETWCNLFSPATDHCVQDHNNLYATTENYNELFESDDQEAFEFELEQMLVLDILERVIKYFVRVHLSDIRSKFLDEKMAKKKKYSHRSQVDGIHKDASKHISCEFPCAICQKECIDVTIAKDAMPEENSILCESCNKWFHFVCIGITGNEDFLKAGNDIDYICRLCDTQLNETLMTIDHTNTEQSLSSTHTGRGRGKGKGKGRGMRCVPPERQSSFSSNSTSTSIRSENENSGMPQRVTRSGRTVKKPAKLTS